MTSEPKSTACPGRTADHDEDCLTDTVTDNGHGILGQEWNAILPGEETPLEHDSGLGLWYIEWLVERARLSRTLGRGSVWCRRDHRVSRHIG